MRTKIALLTFVTSVCFISIGYANTFNLSNTTQNTYVEAGYPQTSCYAGGSVTAPGKISPNSTIQIGLNPSSGSGCTVIYYSERNQFNISFSAGSNEPSCTTVGANQCSVSGGNITISPNT